MAEAMRDRNLVALDGLRALAVGVILLFHAGFDWFAGGFIGVDVFFVISGFLITRNILQERAEGRFSFGKFYARRAARLFPALFLTLAATLAAGYFLLGPDDLLRLAHSAIAAALSVSNIYFWLGAGYFSPGAETQPLLHTWSLGVEEQFYLVWPALIALAALTKRAWVVTACIALLGAASLAACLVLANEYPSAVFFLTPFRVFQLALGALIACAGLVGASAWRGVLAFAGAFVVVALACVLSGTQSPPWASMLVPALATGAIVIGAENSWVRAAFGSAPLVWIGQRSYSIYLVHWPIGVFWALTYGAPNSATAWGLVAASIVAGALLHWLVERRFRVSAGAPMSRLWVSLGVSAALLAVTLGGAGYIWRGQGFPERLNEEMRLAAEGFPAQRAETETAMGFGHCVVFFDRHTLADLDQSVCTSSTGEDAVLVLGDSWAGNTYLILREAFPERRIDRVVLPGCAFKPVDLFAADEKVACREVYAFALENLVRAGRYGTVVFTSSWDPPYEPLGALFEDLRQRGVRVVVFGQYLVFDQSPPTVVLAASSFGEAQSRMDAVAQRQRVQMDEQMRPHMPDGASFVSTIELQCAPNCDVLDAQGRLMYMDNSHVTTAGAAVFGERLHNAYPDLLGARAP
jgi:peptidoglycan/LPS O-acetylase OafA/YrhL